MTMRSRHELKVLSAFSGAGGMDLGLEAAGFANVGTIEIDEAARDSLRINRPDWRAIGDGDVLSVARELRAADLGLEVGQLDLLAAGPPCQPFSAASQWAYAVRRGMDDERAKTLHSLLDLIETLQPRMVMLENVIGFVQGSRSATPVLEQHIRLMREKYGIEYQLHWKLLNAADYGVPQNRRRVIVILIRDVDPKHPWQWPAPTHGDAPITAWDALYDVAESSSPQPRGKWAALLPSIPEGSNYQWLTRQGGGEELFGYRTKYWNFLLKLAKNQPSWTLAASPGPSSGPFHWDNRPLSPREMMRLQSFPDSWTLPGEYRTQVRLAGNATPPLLAEVMGRAIRQALFGLTLEGGPLLQIERATSPIVTAAPQPVPVEFAAMIGPKSDHPGAGRGPGATPEKAADSAT